MVMSYAVGPGSRAARRSATMSSSSQRTSRSARLLAVLLQGEGVAVHALAVARRGLADVGETLLEPGAPALEDAQTDLRLGAREEGEAHVEVVVVPGVGAAGRDEVLEVLLAVGRQLVGDARPLASGGRLLRLVDPVGVDEPLERRVERAVGQRPEDAERSGESLAQLVAVQGTVVEQTEHRELEQRGAAALRAVGLRHVSTLHTDISLRYIAFGVSGTTHVSQTLRGYAVRLLAEACSVGVEARAGRTGSPGECRIHGGAAQGRRSVCAGPVSRGVSFGWLDARQVILIGGSGRLPGRVVACR